MFYIIGDYLYLIELYLKKVKDLDSSNYKSNCGRKFEAESLINCPLLLPKKNNMPKYDRMVASS